MKNTHLEHPEDAILNRGLDGARQVIKFFREKNNNVSVKWDGAPAIVFGINPENDKFFVGTKSVFNKVKVKINYTHSDIEKNHGNNQKVAAILHTCLSEFPKNIKGIYQCDFIGYGGEVCFTPNTLTYNFDQCEDVLQSSVVAVCHTSYSGPTIKQLEANFIGSSNGNLSDSDSSVYFVNCDASFTSRRSRIDYLLGIADLVVNFVRFPEGKEGQELKKSVNHCIRLQKDLSCAGMSKRLTFLYKLLIYIKHLLMEGIQSKEDVQCFIGDEPTTHEGYVMSNRFGTFKLVNRRQFSYANFTVQKQWDK
jgi:hypothetical protein